MNITYDPYADAMYLYYNGKRKAAKTEEVRSDLLVDFDDKNKLMGIEVLTVSKKLPQKALKSVNLEINLQQPKPLLTK